MKLETVRQTANRHGVLTEHGIRHSLKHRTENGLVRAVVRVGRKLYLDADAFDQWLENQREQAA